MQRFQRALIAWISLAGLLAAMLGLGASMAAADPISSWTAGPNAALDNTYDGYVDVPTANATVGTGGFMVGGWFVDKTAQGWAGADDVQIWQGTMDGGKMLTKASFAKSRPDVAAATGNPYWAASGFNTVIPAGALQAGNQTLSVYAHTPDKGWWYKQVQVNVSGSAATAPAPFVSGGAPPVLVIETPKSGDKVGTKPVLYTIIGYALDRNASVTQGSQGTGIDRVSVYINKERENKDTSFLGNADLAYSDQPARTKYGSQFANSGWRLTFKPTSYKSGSHTLYVYAHSLVTNKEDLETVDFNIVENG